MSHAHLVTSVFPSGLLTTSQAFSPDGYNSLYFCAIQVMVSESGSYSFTSTSDVHYIAGYMYINSFDPASPNSNLFEYDVSGPDGNYPYLVMTVYLSQGDVYILVITTFWPKTIGTFMITATGPAAVTFTLQPITTTRCIEPTAITTAMYRE